MDVLIYGLCAATAMLTAGLLLRAYLRVRLRLLFWSGLCFVGLTLNNLLLVADKVVFPTMDLALPRVLTSLVSMVVLLYGLIFGEER